MGDRSVIERMREVERSFKAEGRKKLNGVTVVLAVLRGSNHEASPHTMLQAVQTLRAIFTDLIEMGDVGHAAAGRKGRGSETDGDEGEGAGGGGTAKAKYRSWVDARYDEFFEGLLTLVRSRERGLQVPGYTTALHLLTTDARTAEATGRVGRWDRTRFHALISAVVDNRHFSNELRDAVSPGHAVAFGDFALRLCEALRDVMLRPPAEPKVARGVMADNVFALVWALSPVMAAPLSSDCLFYDARPADFNIAGAGDMSEEYLATISRTARRRKRRKIAAAAAAAAGGREGGGNEEVSESLALAAKQAFSGAWMALLSRGDLSADCVRQLLLEVHTRLLPVVQNPLRLADFLTAAYSHGGVVALLALDGIFALMTHHKLEYPEFYVKLYALFDDGLLHSKYRARFFKLADLFLSSSHVPAYLVAAFVKRVVRLCLHGPAAGVLLGLAFAHNTLNRHRTVAVLIHRPSGGVLSAEEAADEARGDPYLMDEADPAKSRALESSLWELELLFDHYLPDMSAMARTFKEDFVKKRLDVTEFSAASYQSLFDREIKRRTKHHPVAFRPVQSLLHEDPAFKFWDLS